MLIFSLATKHILAPKCLEEIILSAGSIGTSHILLHSGIGSSTELAALGIVSTHHLPDVGKKPVGPSLMEYSLHR